MVSSYRREYGLFAVNAILFPHESPRRHANFAFKKIIRAAVAIKSGKRDKLQLGNLHVLRDWGYAPEYVNAMYRMLSADDPEDYCLCTGNTKSVQDVVQAAFDYLEEDWRKHVEIAPKLCRVNEPTTIVGDGSKAIQKLDWSPKVTFDELIKRVADYESRMYTGLERDYGNECARYY